MSRPFEDILLEGSVTGSLGIVRGREGTVGRRGEGRAVASDFVWRFAEGDCVGGEDEDSGFPGYL